MEHAEDEYYQWLSKSLSRPCGGEGDAHMDVDRETMKKKSKFDLLRLDYLGLLTDLNSRRRFELLAFFGKFIQVTCLIDFWQLAMDFVCRPSRRRVLNSCPCNHP